MLFFLSLLLCVAWLRAVCAWLRICKGDWLQFLIYAYEPQSHMFSQSMKRLISVVVIAFFLVVFVVEETAVTCTVEVIIHLIRRPVTFGCLRLFQSFSKESEYHKHYDPYQKSFQKLLLHNPYCFLLTFVKIYKLFLRLQHPSPNLYFVDNLKSVSNGIRENRLKSCCAQKVFPIVWRQRLSGIMMLVDPERILILSSM